MGIDVAIKVSSRFGIDARGAELHTVECICDQLLALGISFGIVGAESYDGRHKRFATPARFRYRSTWKTLQVSLHMPLAILNLWSFLKTQNQLPRLLMCTGGVYYNGSAVVVCAKIYGLISLVRTAEDHAWVDYSGGVISPSVIKRLILRVLSIWVLKRADHALTTGCFSARYFTKLLGRSVIGIPGPADLTHFKTVRNLRVGLGEEKQKKVELIFVGSFERLKGRDQLIELARQLDMNQVQCNLNLIGPARDLVSKILPSGQYVSVVCYGPLGHHEMAKIFAKCDCLLFFTQLGVGYGQVNLQAIASGLAVLYFKPAGDVLTVAMPDQICTTVNQMVERINDRDFLITDPRMLQKVADFSGKNGIFIQKILRST